MPEAVKEVTELSPDTPTEEIIKNTPKEEAEPSQEPSPEEQPSEETPEPTEKVEKTPEEESDEGQGKPIPYNRFKEVNDERKTLKSENEEIRAELEELHEILSDQEVVNFIKSRKEAPAKPDFSGLVKDLDLTTQEGWLEAQYRVAQLAAKQATQPVEGKIKEREISEKLDSQKVEAEKLAKEVFEIEYGDEAKDLENPETAVGKIASYIDKHPEKKSLIVQGILSKSDILRLALSEENHKRVEQKGIQKEKKRQEDLKSAAMEGEAGVTIEDYPQPDWSTQRITEWLQKHPNVKL